MSVIFLGEVSESFILSHLSIPLFIESVSAGFPSPAQSYVEQSLDLNELCIHHPNATFFVRVQGNSMIDAHILPGDILVVDRTLQAMHGDVVIASVQGEFTVKQLLTKPTPKLVACNKDYPAIEIIKDMELEIFGVVRYTIHAVCAPRTKKSASS
ncbi:MAG: translesion error-prone DNA polymerase V autoproteolytic subunit [Pseudomonadota bacterium]